MSPVEIVPIVSGLLLGVLLAWMEPALQKRVGLSGVIAVSFLATILSGEYRMNWGFLLMDIVLVVVATLAGLVASQRVRCRENSDAQPTPDFLDKVA